MERRVQKGAARGWARVGPLPRAVLSLGLVLIAAALGMGAAFAIQAIRGYTVRIQPGGRTIYRVSPREELTGMAVAGTSVVLGALLIALWRSAWGPAVSPGEIAIGRRVRWAAAATLLGVVAGVAVWWGARSLPMVGGDRDYLAGAAMLLIAGLVNFAWAPAAACIEVRWAPEAMGPIPCAGCGYDMASLSELTCPECGRKHTVEEVVRGNRVSGGG